MADYWSIEVFNGSGSSAMSWRQSYGSALVESALSNGASEWAWVETRWGVVLEVSFAEEADWLRFRGLPAVRAALDGVPDPVNGLLVYRGRGGSAGSRSPRRPRPSPAAGAMALEEIITEHVMDLTETVPGEDASVLAQGGPTVTVLAMPAANGV
jgi:hypothetical protein